MMIGDSIAVGVGQARPECETVAKVGISSSRYIATLLPPGRTEVDTAVISLGVNDDASLDTIGNLREVRTRIVSPNVVWLLPALKDNVRAMIRTVAAENGDRTVDTRPQAGPDHLHPTGTGYEIIAAKTVGARDEEVAAYEPAARHTGPRLRHHLVHSGRPPHGAVHARAAISHRLAASALAHRQLVACAAHACLKRPAAGRI
jgi:lysophospholipase L1-like esterase